MADYAAKIAALEEAAASGELTVESDGDRVTYRSMKDLLGALAYFEKKQGAAGNGGRAVSATTVVSYEAE